MTTTPAQPVQGPYRVSALAGDACGYWVHAADGSVVGHVSNTARYIRLDNGEAWNKCVEPYSSYREWIKPELAHEAEIRKATARLLAASWEMREALNAIVAYVEDHPGLLNDMHDEMADAYAALKKCEAAP